MQPRLAYLIYIIGVACRGQVQEGKVHLYYLTRSNYLSSDCRCYDFHPSSHFMRA